MRAKMLSFAMAAVLAGGVGVSASSAQTEGTSDATETATPLKLKVVFSRYQGETLVGRLPFTLLLNSDDTIGRMKMGLTVPINVRIEGGEGPPTVMYKDAATGVECRARPLSRERFALVCEFYQDAVYSPADGEPVPDKADLAPAIRRFASETTLVMRDGQTLQHSATDPLTGEVVEVDVTLSVLP